MKWAGNGLIKSCKIKTRATIWTYKSRLLQQFSLFNGHHFDASNFKSWFYQSYCGWSVVIFSIFHENTTNAYDLWWINKLISNTILKIRYWNNYSWNIVEFEKLIKTYQSMFRTKCLGKCQYDSLFQTGHIQFLFTFPHTLWVKERYWNRWEKKFASKSIFIHLKIKQTRIRRFRSMYTRTHAFVQ